MMFGEDMSSSARDKLEQAFAAALETELLSAAEAAFLVQASEDIAPGELAELTPDDLAANLAAFWRFGAQRNHPGPKYRLTHALGVGGVDLKLELLQIIQDDAPFLVDSVMGALAEAGFDVRAMAHPVVQIGRTADGLRDEAAEPRPESMILVVLGDVGEDRRAALLDNLGKTLTDVHMAVQDFDAMTALMAETVVELKAVPNLPGPYPVEEYLDFLAWLSEHFVFLGARRYRYPRTPEGDYAAEEPRFGPEDCFGVMRDLERSVLRRANEPAILTSGLKTYLEHDSPLVAAKSNLKSRVHRRGYMDYVGVKRYGPDGAAVGEVRFVGLYTMEAYEEPARTLPLVRRKIARVLAQAGDNPSEHTEKRLRYIVETYPRDELFQISEEELLATAMGILHLHDRPRVKLFARQDTFDRFISCLVFIPRERFDSDAERKAGRILAEGFGGRISATYASYSDQALVRVHYIIGVTPGQHLYPDSRVLETKITEAVRTWADRFEAAARAGGVAPGLVAEILARYQDAFPPGYRDIYDADEALADLTVIEGMGAEQALHIRAYREANDTSIQFRVKLYRTGEAVPLADVMPILGHMGLKAVAEDGFQITRTLDAETRSVTWVHDFLLEDPRGEHLIFNEIRSAFEAAFIAVWAGRTESDGFNRLVLELGVDWREAALLRAFARYRQQSGLDPTQPVQEAALRDHAHISRLILDLFRIKFDPGLVAGLEERTSQAEEVFTEIVAALQAVESLDADRVLRRIALLVRALTRTNFYQTDASGAPKSHISFKIASQMLEDLPAPKPYREIFVWAPHVEGVHPRFGPVARGGLRWSDRRDDFRTEVLGLVKAQNVKNAVIVPVGSKGGFYPKALPRGGAAEAVRAEGVRAYRTFLSGLLDITDNLDASGGVIRPDDVIAHEGDDPYLVVAADKGTATFSDIANSVAEAYGFWLGDAFASGGSAGYDHKVMGITARGAWEAVKRHFRELGKDIQTEPFTCVGVGDMSGDVFGNGALLSKAMKLVAAFDHRHIFIDPAPDAALSWAERKRLFDLPRSSWLDYDRKLLSAGGGIHDRAAKSIALSDEARAVLDIGSATVTPIDLMRAILKAPADLLYFGGIGTYVKASSETNADAGDRATDSLRIDATEVRAKVVGEGANLGFTQRGRIEAALAGVKINTDALDNSAGVDTSDHEVNIKIATGVAIETGALAAPERDALLFGMTDEVATLVLRHNYQQSQAITVAEAQAAEEHDGLERFMRALERQGRLDRTVEFLPNTAAMRARAASRQFLTRPELCVLLAYAKIDLSDEILNSDLPDDPLIEGELLLYFPTTLRQKFEPVLRGHRLRREIATLQVVNSLVNRCGPTFVRTVGQRTGASAAAIARAFAVVRDAWKLRDLWADIEALDDQLKAEAQARLLVASQRFLSRTVQWTLRRLPQPLDTLQATEQLGAAVTALGDLPESLIGAAESHLLAERTAAFTELGAPASVARRAAALETLAGAGDLLQAARTNGCSIDVAARLYFRLGERLSLAAFGNGAQKLPRDGQWPSQAANAMLDELAALHADLLGSVLRATGPQGAADPDAALAHWGAGRALALERVDRLKEELAAAGPLDLAMLSVATAELRALV